jgi:3-oxoacyl-[acyl-carrier-protein] synthase-3
MAQRCLVIGSETLSRVMTHDRLHDLFRRGWRLNYRSFDDDTGMLSYESGTYAMDEANYFFNHTTLI